MSLYVRSFFWFIAFKLGNYWRSTFIASDWERLKVWRIGREISSNFTFVYDLIGSKVVENCKSSAEAKVKRDKNPNIKKI